MKPQTHPYLNYRHSLKDINDKYKVPGMSIFFNCRSELGFAQVAYLFMSNLDIKGQKLRDLEWLPEFLNCTALFTLGFSKCPYFTIQDILSSITLDKQVLSDIRDRLVGLLEAALLMRPDKTLKQRKEFIKKTLTLFESRSDIRQQFEHLESLINNPTLFNTSMRHVLKEYKELYDALLCINVNYPLTFIQYAFNYIHGLRGGIFCATKNILEYYNKHDEIMTCSNFKRSISYMRETLRRSLCDD